MDQDFQFIFSLLTEKNSQTVLFVNFPETFCFLGHHFYFLFYRFFLQQVRVERRNKNKICSDHFPIEGFDFNSIGKWSE